MIQTMDVHYNYSDYGSGINISAGVYVQVDCPDGAVVVSGGVLQCAADADWQAAAVSAIGAGGHAGPPAAYSGTAADNLGPATSNSGHGTSVTPNPCNPRPDGASWRMSAELEFPYTEQSGLGQSYGMTVTYYAIYL